MLWSGAWIVSRSPRPREHEAALRARGVAHAALFGSRARGGDRPDGDTDIMVELDPAARLTLFDDAGVKEDIASVFDGPVDVANREPKTRCETGRDNRGD